MAGYKRGPISAARKFNYVVGGVVLCNIRSCYPVQRKTTLLSVPGIVPRALWTKKCCFLNRWKLFQAILNMSGAATGALCCFSSSLVLGALSGYFISSPRANYRSMQWSVNQEQGPLNFPSEMRG